MTIPSSKSTSLAPPSPGNFAQCLVDGPADPAREMEVPRLDGLHPAPGSALEVRMEAWRATLSSELDGPPRRPSLSKSGPGNKSHGALTN